MHFAFWVGSGGDAWHFVSIHPKFSQNQLVYISYPKRDNERLTLAVARGRLSGAKLTDVQEIFVADAWETGGNLAGRVLFGPDGMLYVTLATGTACVAPGLMTTGSALRRRS